MRLSGRSQRSLFWAAGLVALLVGGTGRSFAHLSPGADVADCASSSDGTARYFVTVVSRDGSDITNATGRLFGSGTANAGQVVGLAIGDQENQANDGFRGGGCVRAPNDGHANDLSSGFLPATAGANTWIMRVFAPGFFPSAAIDLSGLVDGTACPLGDGAGCLISLGTLVLDPVGAPSTSRLSAATPTPTVVATAVPSPTLPALRPSKVPLQVQPRATVSASPTPALGVAPPQPAMTESPAPVDPPFPEAPDAAPSDQPDQTQPGDSR